MNKQEVIRLNQLLFDSKNKFIKDNELQLFSSLLKQTMISVIYQTCMNSDYLNTSVIFFLLIFSKIEKSSKFLLEYSNNKNR